MYATHRHLTADQLYEMLASRPDSRSLRISRATVYRTLALLEQGGFVQGLDLGRESGTLYEHTLGHEHHEHMICLECGRIIEFVDAELERVQEAVVRRHGFQPRGHRLNVFGTCAACVERGRGEEAGA
jgi:Fur family ferric uptake transcriptional regulator